MTAPTWLVDLLDEHQEDFGYPSSCICQAAIPDPGLGGFLPHLAEVIAAELRARLESDEMHERAEDTITKAWNNGWDDATVTLAAVADALLGGNDADE